MTVLVLGATGLLGNAVFRRLSTTASSAVYGTIRSADAQKFFSPAQTSRLVLVENLENLGNLIQLFENVQPRVVINCIAVGRPTPIDPARSFGAHSVLPQRLSWLCKRTESRLIQISSDGVFSGTRGSYTEDDLPDADDVYGVSKLLGEVAGAHAITLRTSLLGHELHSQTGLLEWFLSQQQQCRCYTRAIFTGIPTVVLADILKEVVIPRPSMHGIYHVASRPISKFDLLQLVAQRYGKTIRLIRDDQVSIDRSLVADRFFKETGYVPPDWPEMIDLMYRDKFRSGEANVQE